jgi:hypothetical protein
VWFHSQHFHAQVIAGFDLSFRSTNLAARRDRFARRVVHKKQAGKNKKEKNGKSSWQSVLLNLEGKDIINRTYDRYQKGNCKFNLNLTLNLDKCCSSEFQGSPKFC